jgi:mannose-6-phosphate isomerase-like protein (cupin superfamily)
VQVSDYRFSQLTEKPQGMALFIPHNWTGWHLSPLALIVNNDNNTLCTAMKWEVFMDGKLFTLSDLIGSREQSGELYHEFLHIPAMSAGVYQLAKGRVDPQEPHTEDELYYVVQGQAQIQVGTEDMAVEPGSLVFVAANVEHRFHSIIEDLTVLVFFAPAEYSRAPTETHE